MTTATITREELPIWMRRAMRGTDWGVLVVLSLCLLASLPFVTYTGVPIGTAYERYVFRAADTAQSLREGRLYPRWTDEALGGYGAPIPNFIPPAAGYLPALIDVTLLNDPPISVMLIFVAALCLSGTATYAFITRRKGAAAGLTAALLYIYNPFIGYTTPHVMGDLSLALGAAFLPALLWSVDRLIVRKGSADTIYAALAFAALWFTDARFALIGFGLAAILVIVHAIMEGGVRWIHLLLAALLGTALAACYWLPALLEESAVVWYPSDTAPTYLLTARLLLSLPAMSDPAAMISQPTFTLGLAAPICALLALILMGRLRSKSSLLPFGMFVGGALLLAFAVMNPTQIWLLMPISLCLAIAGSAALDLRELMPARFSRLIPVAICALAIGSVLTPWLAILSTTDTAALSDFTSQAQVNFEQRGYGIAILPPGDAFPSSIPPNISQDARLLRGYLSGAPRRIVQNGSAQIGVLNDTAHELRLQVQIFADTSLRILTAAFPGWNARIDNRNLTFDLPSNDGMLPALHLPQGERGELIISLEPTLARLESWVLTWTSVGGMALITLRRRRLFPLIEPSEQVVLLTPQEARLFAILLIGVGGLMILPFAVPDFADAAGWRSISGVGLADAQDYNVRSDAGLELIGYNMESVETRPGDSLDLSLYWRSLRQLQENYRIQIALRDRSTERVDTVSPIRHPGGLPTSRWSPRRYLNDSWRIVIPASLSPGDYDVIVAVFACTAACQTREPVTFFDTSGAPLGQTFALPVPVTIIST